MRYLRKFNENRVTLFDPKWIEVLPKSLVIITDNGEFKLERKNVVDKNTNYPDQISHYMVLVQIPYSQNTMEEEDGDALADGEPDNLEFDICMVKNNEGNESNPDTLRLNIDMTYGDNMQCEFTIEKLKDGSSKVECHHYTGKNSLYDPETYFGFSDESLADLVEFFNRFGFDTKPEDYKFLDSDPDSYYYEKPIVKDREISNMTLANNPEVDKLKGGNKILRYQDMDDYKIDLEGEKD